MGYPKQIYDKAWQVLDQRAAEARALTASRRGKAISAVPEIAQIEREMAVGAAGITKVVIASPDRAGELIQELAQKNLALQERRRALLTENGFPPDYLEEQFGCRRCKDKGYIGTEMCACLRELLESEAYARLSASAPVDRYTFESFSLDVYPDTPDQTGISPRARMADVRAFCLRYAQSFSPKSESLLFIGQTGLGKTHLSLAIAAAAIEAGYGVVYTPMQKLMDTLEQGKFSYDEGKKEQYAENIRMIQSCDLLVLDDLGTEFINQFSIAVLYNIINTRQVEGRPTIVSTNLEIEEIEQKYTERMFSRLLCVYKTVQFAGRDVRSIRRSQNRQPV